MKQKILFLGTTKGTKQMVEYAKSQGVYTVVTDFVPYEDSEVKQLADEYWMISTSELDILEKKCREESIDGLAVGVTEYNLCQQMALTERLGLPCYCTPETWHYSIDKADFKSVCKTLNVPVPTDYYVSNSPQLDEIEKIQFPVMVKPVDCAGNTGVSYCNSKEEFLPAYNLAKKVSSSPKVVIERMLHGKEWWAGYALADGEVSLISLCAMYSQPGEPKNCYSLTTNVSNNVVKFVDEINPLIENVLKKIGCKEGFAWVQVMLDEDGCFYVIEMGYRLTGDLVYLLYKDLCGFDTVKWMVDFALGIEHKKEDLPSPQKSAYKKCSTAYMLWTNRSGIISRIEGLDEISNISGISIDFQKKVGDTISAYHSIGNILFTADDVNGMCDIIEKVNNIIHVYNELDEEVLIKYTDFDYLKKTYYEGLAEK